MYLVSLKSTGGSNIKSTLIRIATKDAYLPLVINSVIDGDPYKPSRSRYRDHYARELVIYRVFSDKQPERMKTKKFEIKFNKENTNIAEIQIEFEKYWNKR